MSACGTSTCHGTRRATMTYGVTSQMTNVPAIDESSPWSPLMCPCRARCTATSPEKPASNPREPAQPQQAVARVAQPARLQSPRRLVEPLQRARERQCRDDEDDHA